ncbi:MAG: DUF4255 domain-containing protein [Chloroflexi bacterium]|nr:DUF4255 domain-containing protein [Chloroflexota bacterium]MCI0577460.1 DUF4255 domain-containing protein [Chloroflexota bacterium]MCI0647795.1 DUF4255 domain-containing protein [Chloroflexota bacterium]MCI0729003.1 DUF4255 domain-containing protein [Chloroflexota bacterium]
MADYRAVAAVCEAVIYLLHSNYAPGDFNNELEFRVYTAGDFADPIESGVSLFLYRIFANGSHRIPAGRLTPAGRRQTQLPLDLHFLLTAWGRSASLQQTIAGWMMRVMEDTPILPVGLLDRVIPGVFSANETVEIALAELATEELLHLWETLPQQRYQLSLPYVARNVRIESAQLLGAGEPVQERTFEYQKANNGATS